MIFAVLCLSIVSTGVLSGKLLADYLRRSVDILTERTHAKVIVTLKSGDAFRGVLREQDARALVLVNADGLSMGERGTDASVDGEIVILREDVAYLQVL
jgi:small nuclear ribonucleoprotein (snRNP)-like protein